MFSTNLSFPDNQSAKVLKKILQNMQPVHALQHCEAKLVL